MKKAVRIVWLCVLVGVLIPGLIACGGDSADDANLGLYKATTAMMSGISVDVEEIWSGGFTMELKKKGKGTAEIDGESAIIKWTLEGESFNAEGGGVTFNGTLKDGVLVLDNFGDSDITLTLVCDEAVAKAKAGGSSDNTTGKTGATLAGKRDVSDGDETESVTSTDSVYGDYDAVGASVDGEEEVWIEEGEYLTVNNDDTVSMYVAEQDLDFDTSIRDNKFYLNGDTKVGEINDDGSITLSLSDTVKYTFAKEGSVKWKQWREAMGEGDEPSETVMEEDEPEEDDDTSGGSAKDKLNGMLSEDEEDIGKWELFTLTRGGKSYMEEDLKKKGIESWIRIDPDGKGQIYLVGDLMDMEWGNGRIVVPENNEGNRDEYRYSISSGFLVLVDEDMTLAFRRVE